jgi:hypothetical protein
MSVEIVPEDDGIAPKPREYNLAAVQGVQAQLRFRDTDSTLIVAHGVSNANGKISLRAPSASYELNVIGHGFRASDIYSGSSLPVGPEGGPVEIVVGQSNRQNVFGEFKDDIGREAEFNYLKGLVSQIQWVKFVIPEMFTTIRKEFRDETADPDDTFSNLALQEFSRIYKGGSSLNHVLLATDPSPEFGTTIFRTTEGLIWKDTFTGTGSLDSYNGWTVGHGTINRTSGVVDPTNESWARKDFTFPASEEIIAQCNLINEFAAFMVGNVGTTGAARLFNMSDGSGYYMRHRDNLNQYELFSASDSGLTQRKTGGDDPGSTTWNANRIVIELSGTDRVVSAWHSTDIGGSEADSGTLSQVGTDYTDTSPPAASEFTQFAIDFTDGDEGADVAFICGRNIQVNGLPTGWKVKLDADSPVTESGGSVTFNVDARQLPVLVLKVLNVADVVQVQFTDVDDIWGGDIFQVFA